MKLKVYSIFDVKAGTYGTPFFSVNDAIARRSFEDLAKDSNSTVSRHPEDYSLYQIGEFDGISAMMVGVSAPVYISKAVDFTGVVV